MVVAAARTAVLIEAGAILPYFKILLVSAVINSLHLSRTKHIRRRKVEANDEEEKKEGKGG